MGSTDSIDIGDKFNASIGHKMNMGNYESMDFHTSISITKREGENDEEFTTRAWAIVQQQLEDQVAESGELGKRLKSEVFSQYD